MFEGDPVNMRARKFLLVLMGAEQRVSRAQTRERGPPSALAEILQMFLVKLEWDCAIKEKILSHIFQTVSPHRV